MKIIRNNKGPQPTVIPALQITAKEGDVFDLPDEIAMELIDQGHFDAVPQPPVAPVSKPKPSAPPSSID